jgi:signal transduction histidine kinase
VLVSDRLATRIIRPAPALAAAAAALGEGDLTARSAPAGPPELVATGHAFNLMAERLSRLISAERVLAADLPHRLRTPLTALRMNAASLGPGRAAEETRLAVTRMEQEIDLIIRAARRPAPGEPSGCDAAEVLRDRLGFWSALAEDQGRPCHLTGADRPARVPVPRSDLAAAADALIGNVFRHTAEGTGLAVTLHAGHDVVLVFFADAGRGPPLRAGARPEAHQEHPEGAASLRGFMVTIPYTSADRCLALKVAALFVLKPVSSTETPARS